MAKSQTYHLYLNNDAISYLKEVARNNDRSLSYSVNEVITYAVQKHQAVESGNQTSLDLLRVLGPSPAQAANSQRDSGLLQRSPIPSQEGAKST